MQPTSFSVVLDPLLQPLVAAFLDDTRHDVAGMAASLAQGDLRSVGTTAHMLKGNGGSYGFEFISTLGLALQQAAAAGNNVEVERLLRQLTTYVDNVEVTFA